MYSAATLTFRTRVRYAPLMDEVMREKLAFSMRVRALRRIRQERFSFERRNRRWSTMGI